MEVNISKHQMETLLVYEEDKPIEAVEKFCRKYKIGNEKEGKLKSYVE